ncbi:MAG: substrate-binding domain-containing protein [Anaerolineales bacterium]|nr:substrate-binding domain-containing protein [Anaerolineales bacterium]
MKTKHVVFSLLIIAGLLLAACGGGADEPTVTLSSSGAFALYPMMQRYAEEYSSEYPHVAFDITGGGAGKGISDVLAGATDFGMVSRELRTEEIELGAVGFAVARDAVFVVVNANNPYLDLILERGLTTEALNKLYVTQEFSTWGDLLGDPSITDAVNVYTRSDSAGAAEMIALFYGADAQEDLKGIGVDGDPGLLTAVLNDPLGIGYNNLGFVYDFSTGVPVAGAVVAPVDLNTNGQIEEHELLETREEAVQAILDGDYPSPPSRLLYVVTKGQPSGDTLDFLRWIYSDGQAFVAEAGYVPLSADELAGEISRLP